MLCAISRDDAPVLTMCSSCDWRVRTTSRKLFWCFPTSSARLVNDALTLSLKVSWSWICSAICAIAASIATFVGSFPKSRSFGAWSPKKRQLPNFSYIMTMWQIPQKYATQLACPRWQSGRKNKRFFVKNSPGSIVQLNNSPLIQPQKQPSLIHPLNPHFPFPRLSDRERKNNKTKTIELCRTTCVVRRDIE